MTSKIKKSDSKLVVKFAGGAAAQCLALMNGIYLKSRIKKSFVLKYFPYSTGTYWPLAIEFLLKDGELAITNGKTRGLADNQELEIGKIIRTHPLVTKFFSYEKLLTIIRKLRLEAFLQATRGERQIEAKLSRLNRVTKKVRAVSGGYVPILDQNVCFEMDERFKFSGKNSPFSKSKNNQDKYRIVIHYRIGDKRAKFSHHKDFGGDGIVDPESFLLILDSLDCSNSKDIYVVSDEPTIAQQLLRNVGIKANLNPTQGDIWEDLYLMSQAETFIGSWSQVSQLAGICVVNNGYRAFLPSTTQVGTKIRWNVEGIQYFEPKFLPSSHPIYSSDFVLEETAHSSYKDDGKAPK